MDENKFIQFKIHLRVGYAKNFISSSLFHLQYSSDVPTIMQNIFMVNINLCVRFVARRSLHDGKVGT